MSAVRRHLLGVVALVLALAVGVALGAGPLSRESLLPTAAPAAVERRVETSGPSADDVTAEAARTLLRGRLDGRGVALVSTPGVDRAVTDALAVDVEASGGAVVARWRAGSSLVGANEKTLVDTLGEQLLEQLDGRGAEPDATSYERMGQLVGTAVASRQPTGVPAEQDALTIRQSLDAATLLSGDDPTARRAPLVLLVLGDDLDDDVVEGLVTGLGSRASGLVVAGPRGAGDLSVLAATGTLTTVDGVGSALGRVASVLALARVEQEPVGSYGASGADAHLPLG